MAAAKYIDVPNRLSKGNVLVYDSDVIREELERLLLTEKGSFIDLPDYGVSLKRYLYEPLTDQVVPFIDMEIRNAIGKWMEDTVTLNGLTVDVSEDNNSFVVYLDIYINEFDKQLVVSVPYDETT